MQCCGGRERWKRAEFMLGSPGAESALNTAMGLSTAAADLTFLSRIVVIY